MLYDKTNENNSFLEELQSFCLALIAVSTFFYIGLNSLHFNHGMNTITSVEVSTVDAISFINQPVFFNEFNAEVEICKDLIVDIQPDNKTPLLPTINTQTPIRKSKKRLVKKMKIEDPVITTPPTGLSSSSFKAIKKPVKAIKLPVTHQQEPVLGVSKPYILNKSLSGINPPVVYNNILVNSAELNLKEVKKAKNKSIASKKLNELSELLYTSLQAAEANNKMIILSFGAKWCSPCKQMDNIVYTNSDVKSIINEHYIFIKLNEKEFETITLKDLYDVKVYPTTIVLDSKGIIKARYEEGLSSNRMITILNDHIPTDQTKPLVASNEIELNKSHLELIDSGIEYLVKSKEERNFGLRK